MFVSACNLEYVPYTKLWLRSLLKAGQRSERACVIVFGDRDSCVIASKDLRRTFPGLNLICADLRDRRFRFLAPLLENRNYSSVADYLRAWAGKKFGSYVWMDSDALVRKPVGALADLARSGKTLRMPAARMGIWIYFDAYRRCFGGYPTVYHDKKGRPVVMNSGVIVADRNYEEEWRDGFLRFLKAAQRPPRRRLYLDRLGSDVGQIVWNFVFWNRGGEVLSPQYHRHHLESHSRARVIQYGGNQKAAMLRDAVRLGLA